ARREAADEDAVVEKMRLHADAVAEHGAAAERTRGIDRNDADRGTALPQMLDQPIDERRLAGTRRPGDADHVGLAGALVDAAHDATGLAVAVLDERDQLGERDAVAAEHTLDQAVDRILLHQRPL